MRYTGRTRRRWFFFTQYEYEFRGYVGARWQHPGNSEKWPLCKSWTYVAPAVEDIIESTRPANDEARFLGDVQRLVLNPGDRVVLMSEERLSMDAAEHLRAVLQERFPGHETVVLDKGLKLGVLGKAAA